MANSTERPFVPVASEAVGLDRTRIDHSGQVQLVTPSSSTDPSNSRVSDQNEAATKSRPPDAQLPDSKRKRILLKTKEKLHITKHDVEPTAPVLADARDTASDERLGDKPPEPEKHNVKDFMHHPAATVQSKVTGHGGHQIASNLVAKEISHGTEVEVVRAQAEVEKSGTEAEGKERKNALDVLMRDRQDMFIRWTMDRHVSKVRILPVGTVPKLSRDDFKTIGEDGKERIDWEGWGRHILKYNSQKYGSRYIGYNSSAPTPSKETMMPAVERLLVASAPLQTLIMLIRRVYRWENRNETLKYLVIYGILWIFDLVLPGFLAAMIYFILYRRIRAPTIDDLRQDIKRVEDLTETALTLSEFIEKKGDQSWLDPLIEEVGPWMMVQLADLSDLMETLRNFYEWRVPSQTAQTLGLLTVGLLVVSFTPIHLLMRMATLFGGITFFALFPIGSHFPEYRLLVSPIKWLFWNIPTHAEWSIVTLQAEGQRHRDSKSSSRDTDKHETLKPDPMGYRGAPTKAGRENSSPSAIDPASTDEIYGSYSCSHDNKQGKLMLNAAGVCFVSSIGHKQHFSLPYEKINRLEKVMRIVSKGLSQKSGEDLKMVGPDGAEYTVVNVTDRDQAFSQIVGFSSVRWQIVW